MKYLTKEVANLTSDTMEVMLKNNERFERQSLALREEFDRCKDKLPDKVVEFYHKAHDADILSICTDCTNEKVNIRISVKMLRPMANGIQNGVLLLHDVKTYTSDISFRPYDSCLARLIYNEMLLEDDGFWVYNVLTSPYFNEINIKCKEIEWIDNE